METKHTREPWKVSSVGVGFEVEDKHENVIAQSQQIVCDRLHEERKANARRIVACVNACVGISTEQLETWSCMSRPILKSLMELKAEADREAKQRDALLWALQSLVGDVTAFDCMKEAQPSIAKARAAIAKATGDE